MIPRVSRLSRATRLTSIRTLPTITNSLALNRNLATAVKENDDGFAGANAFYVEQSKFIPFFQTLCIIYSKIIFIIQCIDIGKKV